MTERIIENNRVFTLTTPMIKDDLSKITKDDERAYFIGKIMVEKGVSREVAEAEYDFFG